MAYDNYVPPTNQTHLSPVMCLKKTHTQKEKLYVHEMTLKCNHKNKSKTRMQYKDTIIRGSERLQGLLHGAAIVSQLVLELEQ